MTRAYQLLIFSGNYPSCRCNPNMIVSDPSLVELCSSKENLSGTDRTARYCLLESADKLPASSPIQQRFRNCQKKKAPTTYEINHQPNHQTHSPHFTPYDLKHNTHAFKKRINPTTYLHPTTTQTPPHANKPPPPASPTARRSPPTSSSTSSVHTPQPPPSSPY